MSILSELLKKKITFGQAAEKAAGWVTSVVGQNAAVSASAGQLLSDVKQGASNAVAAADGALADHYAELVTGGEALLEGALAKATGGVTVPFNPLISDGIDNIAAMLKAAADAWALKTKSELAAPATKAA